jgi:hypothetical protein
VNTKEVSEEMGEKEAPEMPKETTQGEEKERRHEGSKEENQEKQGNRDHQQ